MKKMIFQAAVALSIFASFQAQASKTESSDIRANPEFVKTCPEEFLTYIDKSEGGPGAYCACPEENISYIDKSEGGPGFYCAPSAD